MVDVSLDRTRCPDDLRMVDSYKRSTRYGASTGQILPIRETFSPRTICTKQGHTEWSGHICFGSMPRSLKIKTTEMEHDWSLDTRHRSSHSDVGRGNEPSLPNELVSSAHNIQHSIQRDTSQHSNRPWIPNRRATITSEVGSCRTLATKCKI